MSFRITGLPAETFAHLFALSGDELTACGAVRRIADARMPGYPCRVSLTDSRPGDELLLVNWGSASLHPPDAPLCATTLNWTAHNALMAGLDLPHFCRAGAQIQFDAPR